MAEKTWRAEQDRRGIPIHERAADLRDEIAALPRSDYPTVLCIRRLLQAHLDDTEQAIGERSSDPTRGRERERE